MPAMKRSEIVAGLRELQAFAYGSPTYAENRAAKEKLEHRHAYMAGVLQARFEHLARQIDALAEKVEPTRRRRSA